MARWEYRQIIVESWNVTAEQLNTLGQEGWELVSVVASVAQTKSSTQLQNVTEVVPLSARRYAKMGKTVVDVEHLSGSAETSYESEFQCIAYLKRSVD